MKITVLVVLHLFFFSAYANISEKENQLLLGGVDVGNGRVVNSSFEIKQDFDSEDELLSYFNQISKDIVNGKHAATNSLIRLGDCAKNKVTLKNLHFRNHYLAENGKLLQKKFKGIVNLDLYKCGRPEIVRANEKLLPPIRN